MEDEKTLSPEERKRKTIIKNKSEVRKYQLLKEAFLKLYEEEKKAKDNRVSNFDKLSSIKETDNPRLNDIYNLFVSEMKKVENAREKHLNNIKDIYLPVLDYYPKRLKETENNLETYEQAVERKEKLEKSRNNIKNEDVDINKLNQELATSKRVEKEEEGKLEDNICNFEEQRLDDNKFLFLRFVHSELKYHAEALGIMSELFNTIKNNETRLDLKDFEEKYNIKIDYEKLDINIEKLKKIEESRRNKEEESKNKVYDNKENSEEEDQKSSNHEDSHQEDSDN